MSKSTALVKRLAHEDDAGTAVIAVALIAALVAFKDQIMGMFNRAGNNVRSAT